MTDSVRLECDTGKGDPSVCTTSGWNVPLKNILSADELKQFCRKIPKIELHAHLNGCAKPEFIQSITGQPSFPALPPRNLEDCFHRFSEIHSAIQSLEVIEELVQHTLSSFNNDRCRYLELRTTLRKIPTEEAYLRTVVTAIEEFMDVGDIVVRLIVSINREKHRCLDDVLSIERAIKAVNSPLIVGIDISGNPEHGSSVECVQFLRETASFVRDPGMHHVYSAEVRGMEPETERLLGLRPERLGHCTHLSELDWQRVAKLDSLVEICISSNVLTGTVSDADQHHLLDVIRFGIPVAICTDDPGVFAVDLSTEYQMAIQIGDWSAYDVYNIVKNSLTYSFLQRSPKDTLINQILEEFRNVCSSFPVLSGDP